MTHKITPIASPLFCNPYVAKHTTANIDATFPNVFIQNSLVVLIPYLLTYTVYIYGSYRKNKTGVPLFETPCI